MNTSSCTFKNMTFGEQTRTKSIFGTKKKTIARTIAVDESQDRVDIVSFSSPSETSKTDPDPVLQSDFYYAGEPMSYLQVSLNAVDAPIGSEVALEASNLDTTPPIEIVRTTVDRANFNRFVQVTGIDPGYRGVLTLSFWRNGKKLKTTATLSVDVLRVVKNASIPGLAIVPGGVDVFGQSLGEQGSIGYPIGQSSMAIVR